MHPGPSYLIIGCGNPDRGDDAAGALAVQKLRALGLNAIQLSGELSELLTVFERAQEQGCLILIDAVLSGAPPGTIHVWDVGSTPLPRQSSACSAHGLGVAEAIELARALGKLPAKMRIYGIEAGHFRQGQAPCPEVQRAVDQLVSVILQELC